MATERSVISRIFSHNALYRKMTTRIVGPAPAISAALGFVCLAFLPLAAKEYYVTASALNVRATPSLTAEIVNLLPQGMTVNAEPTQSTTTHEGTTARWFALPTLKGFVLDAYLSEKKPDHITPYPLSMDKSSEGCPNHIEKLILTGTKAQETVVREGYETRYRHSRTGTVTAVREGLLIQWSGATGTSLPAFVGGNFNTSTDNSEPVTVAPQRVLLRWSSKHRRFAEEELYELMQKEPYSMWKDYVVFDVDKDNPIGISYPLYRYGGK